MTSSTPPHASNPVGVHGYRLTDKGPVDCLNRPVKR